MPVLALDTSAAVAVAVTADDGTPLAGRRVAEERRHAELLGPMITAVLADAGLDRHALRAVVAGTGPAPFTGLRVGLVTARTLALALGVPVLGVCSLDAIAAQAVEGLRLPAGTPLLVATDARRREVYWARYRAGAGPDVETEAGPGVLHPADLVSAGGAGDGAVVAGAAADGSGVDGSGVEGSGAAGGVVDGTVVVGRGAALYPDVLTLAPGAPLDPDPAVLARLALVRRDRGVPQPSEPLYLRRPDVMEPAARKRALG